MSGMQSIEEYALEFFQDILTRASAEQVQKEEALFETVSEILIDEGEFEESIYAYYRPASGGMQVNGYCGDPFESIVAKEANAGTLGLIALDFNPEGKIKTITQTEINAICKRVCNFVRKAKDRQFRDSLEETSPGSALADLIDKRWAHISKIKIYLFTNKAVSSRVSGISSKTVDDKPVVFDLWDITTLYKLDLSGRKREDLLVDFCALPSGPLRALKAGANKSTGEVYLAAIPGLDLAMIYDKWGARLLEQNVRVFLQARSNVNKSIKATLENEPEMFFSFNNGLTTTAEDAVAIDTENGLCLASLRNLQIVNGGQTTASIYAAYKRGVDLSKVYVQMKLNVISPAKAEELVPQISRSANSQNKVSDADFFSNHPYHIRIEELSRRIYSPRTEGLLTQTKWFYERARGQYRDAQSQLSKSQRSQFASEYPKKQLFTKTDLAKYLMVWTDDASFVNKGAQKNFAEFAKVIAEVWSSDDAQFNEVYFHEVVAKKIIFGATERIVTQREWYEPGGYRSQHVVLALGYLSSAVTKMQRVVDFERIWNRQEISDAFAEAIGQAADCAHEVLMHPEGGSHNISEWAKSPKCMDLLRQKKTGWNEEWLAELVKPADVRDAKIEARKEQRELNGINAQTKVITLGDSFWSDVLAWAKTNHEGTPKDWGVIESATKTSRGKIPSDVQCLALLDIMKRLEEAGCPYKVSKAGAARARGRRYLS